MLVMYARRIRVTEALEIIRKGKQFLYTVNHTYERVR